LTLKRENVKKSITEFIESIIRNNSLLKVTITARDMDKTWSSELQGNGFEIASGSSDGNTVTCYTELSEHEVINKLKALKINTKSVSFEY